MRKNKYPLHPSLTEIFVDREGNEVPNYDIRFAKMHQGKRKPHRMDGTINLRPYGKNLYPWISEDAGCSSKHSGSNFRNRKIVRRYQRKALRAQYKRELISAIEDHISESMYDPYELDYDIISADMVYDRIMNREVEEDLFEDSGDSWDPEDSWFDPDEYRFDYFPEL